MSNSGNRPFLQRAAPGVLSLAPYEPGKPVSELAREYGLSDIIKLASNESPLGPGPTARRYARAACDELGRYPDGSAFELREALAERHGVDPAAITLGNGSNDILDLVARVFLGPGRNAVVSRHAFAIYALVSRAVGAECRVAAARPADGVQPFGHDVDRMLERVDADTGVVFVANPNNPTGTRIDEGELRRLLDGVPPQTVVLLDEAYFEYVDDTAYPDGSTWLAHHPNLVVTRTFSKAHGLAALRAGYGLSDPALADLLNRVRQPFNMNHVAQTAALGSLQDDAHVARAVGLNRAGLEQLGRGLDTLGVRWIPSVANFLCVEVGDGARVYRALLREGVIVRPMGGYELPGYVRVTTGLEHENARFLEALGRVLQG
ncbi:MAG TPA: histidinol-phosphate transaminase [Gammaproteobacteria bacterium]|nr:histidinol-phosphate transaminase [Gammaproteobacteria bacterium]